MGLLQHRAHSCLAGSFLYEMAILTWLWWHMLVNPLGRLRQEN